MTVEKKNETEWISVKNKNPDHATWVLITVPNHIGVPITTTAFYEINSDGEEFWIAGCGDGEWEGVYAWMPMPRQAQCFEGGPDKGCECPDHGQSLMSCSD